MNKVGVCGCFAEKTRLLNGQTIKTIIFTEELEKEFGIHSIGRLDTYKWSKNPLKLIFSSILLAQKSENIVIMPAKNGIKVFAPLFLMINIFFRKQLHYVVIGGWLPPLLKSHKGLKKSLKKFDSIYVETQVMMKSLEELGMDNIKILPNFKKLDIVSPDELKNRSNNRPLKICTFSRVMREKGIEDAINIIKKINKSQNEITFILDIYGQIEKGYEEEFEKLILKFPEYINYKGTINYEESVKVLRKYFVLIFPTKFKTEGIPGTVIDAFASGLPVIASNWDSASEIIDAGETGYIYEFNNNLMLEEILIDIARYPNKIESMRENCLEKAKAYLPSSVMSNFTSEI
ncbi:glycosyltransferase [Exiguobacterium sp. s55]|uniref:glycosyltransferase n=1 Tax=Exiguobacterium sp. s55 TaxID=2751245 RepID=UPI001BE7D876|nr:glycosyltransferase [Exiguobacterium sp. s55]